MKKLNLIGWIKIKKTGFPCFKYRDLPSINLIVLSHFHGDHFDQVAEGDPDKSMWVITTSHLAKDWFRGDQISNNTNNLVKRQKLIQRYHY